MFGAGVDSDSHELGIAFRKSVLADADVVFEAGTDRTQRRAPRSSS
jgi:hypothetical protein